MPREYSPFTPGQPVPVEFFVGRLEQVKRLKGDAVAATKPALRVVFLQVSEASGRRSEAWQGQGRRETRLRADDGRVIP